MTIDPKEVNAISAAYTEAWNSGSPEAVAAFYAPDGQIVINRGKPWVGRKGIAEMAAGFFADVPDLNLVCDDVRCAGNHVAYFGPLLGHMLAHRIRSELSDGKSGISILTSRLLRRGVGTIPTTTSVRPLLASDAALKA